MINFKGFFYFKIFMYICIMALKKGDIVICTTNKMYGMTYTLKVGEQYIIDDFVEMSEKTLVSVSDAKTGEHISVFDDRHFIPLDVWREFQLRKILE